ncbi:MAG: hypothetical protein A2V70_15760, partial [Planctomycetes bacterium RBG_13_63_9]
RAYVNAGSQIVLTNTLLANRFVLARHGLEDKVVQINRAGAEIARRATEGRAHVFASMGTSGRMLLTGEVTEEELTAAFSVQADALADGGVDAIVVETMADPAETVLAVAAARRTGLPVVASMTFDSGSNKDRTMMGTTPEQAAQQLTEAGADVVGANCGQGIDGFPAICRRLRASTDRPIWAKANAGMPQLIDGKTVYQQTPEQFAQFVPELVESGAVFIGGCCGTTPEFIRAIARKLRE